MSISTLALVIRGILSEATKLPDSQIVIGSPHEAAEQQKNKAADSDHLSIFFYRIGYSGFPTDAASDGPFYLNAFCLITAFGGCHSGGTPTPGESELNLLGAVLECFHRKPMLKLKNNGHAVQLQIVPTQLSLDDVNHLWSTQNNTPCRLSLAYEFALLPVPMKARVEQSPKVSAISLELLTTESNVTEETKRRFFSSQVPVVEVDIKRSDWAPHVCLLDDAGNPSYSLVLENRPNQVFLIVLGDPAETDLSLEWEIWNQNSRNWQTGVVGENCRPAAAKLSNATAVSVEVPAAFNSDSGQALLHVTRSFKQGESTQTIVSNPVLITVGGSL